MNQIKKWAAKSYCLTFQPLWENEPDAESIMKMFVKAQDASYEDDTRNYIHFVSLLADTETLST